MHGLNRIVHEMLGYEVVAKEMLTVTGIGKGTHSKTSFSY
jgi:hypothetical protein